MASHFFLRNCLPYLFVYMSTTFCVFFHPFSFSIYESFAYHTHCIYFLSASNMSFDSMGFNILIQFNLTIFLVMVSRFPILQMFLLISHRAEVGGMAEKDNTGVWQGGSIWNSLLYQYLQDPGHIDFEICCHQKWKNAPQRDNKSFLQESYQNTWDTVITQWT